MTRYLEIKSGSISETIKKLSDDYQAVFKAELEKTGKGLAQMTDAEKKAFFNKIDKMHNAKSEMAHSMPAKKPGDFKTVLVARPNNLMKPGQEKVLRIPKEKLADYKSKGYIEAESFVPEAKKLEELTAGQKKLPLALQKAIKAKEKKEEVEITEIPGPGGSGGGIDALRAIKGKRLRLQGELEALNKDDPQYKEKKAAKQKEIEAQKEIMARKQREVYGSYDPSREDALDLNEGDLDEKKGPCWTGYKQVGMKNKNGRQVPNCVPEEYVMESGDIVEFVELEEAEFKDIEVRKGDLKLAKDKREQLKNKYNAIMANQATGDEDSIADQIQKLNMSIKKQEQDLIDKMKSMKPDMKKEAVDPERISNLQQKIQKMSADMTRLDLSNPANKTKQAIMKSDVTTAQLRLKDLMQKQTGELNKQVKEMKMGYKSFKTSMKKEQEMMNKKKTMTDKPMTVIDVNPKIVG